MKLPAVNGGPIPLIFMLGRGNNGVDARRYAAGVIAVLEMRFDLVFGDLFADGVGHAPSRP